MNISNNKENNSINSYVINIAILGDPKSGKTSLIECFLKENIEEKNKETVLNIYQSKITEKDFNLDLNYFDISGYYDRDKDLIVDYIKHANIIILCHSFENEFNEEKICFWLEQIQKKAESGRNYIYLVGCKYDIKVMLDYQKGVNTTTIMFPNGNLASFGERIKIFINNNMIREYFIVSSLLNFNVKEMFHSAIKDYLYDKTLEFNKKGNIKENQNCLIF
jgi:small GTP-binding protein